MSVLKNKPIGVFDSGLGGLTILKYFLKRLPAYDYLYLGDNARVPYGEKSPETIYNYSREAVEYLFTAGCPLVIIACNTASAQTLRRLQQEYLPKHWPDRRLLGVIRPLAEYVATRMKDRPTAGVGVIGTTGTIRSGAYGTELLKMLPTLRVIEKSSPLLVPLIEEGWAKKPETKMILKKYLRVFKKDRIDILILACTHYPFLLKEIRQIMGRRVVVPEPGEIIATSLQDYLRRHPELTISASKKPRRSYLATDSNKIFRHLAEKFLQQPIDALKLIKLTDS